MADSLQVFGKTYTNVPGLKATDTSSNVKTYTNSNSFITYYTGTSAPSASLGNNGDIYLKVAS